MLDTARTVVPAAPIAASLSSSMSDERVDTYGEYGDGHARYVGLDGEHFDNEYYFFVWCGISVSAFEVQV